MNELQKTESPLMVAASLVQTDGNMDVAKLKELLEVQERWEATQAKKAYVVAMAAFKENPPEILKDKHVAYATSKGTTDYNHATLSNVTTCINKALSEHGLTASWVTSQDNGSVKVTCKITHIMGHSEETCLSAPPDATGSKNAIQAIGSTVTYLQRYTLLALTGLATYEQDDDGGKPVEPTLPAKPTAEQDKVIDTIVGILEGRTKKKANKQAVAGIFYEQFKAYPSIPTEVDNAAGWLIGLKREAEWVEPETDLKKLLDQAFFEFETENQAYLQKHLDKEFDSVLFKLAAEKKFGLLLTDKTPAEIALCVVADDVAADKNPEQF